MATASLFFATNRKHKGKDRWPPTGYRKDFSKDGMQNLRLGELTLEVNDSELQKFLKKEVTNRRGDGEGQFYPASDASGNAGAMGVKIFIPQLRISSWMERPPSRVPIPEIQTARFYLGSGHRLGEVLQPIQPRSMMGKLRAVISDRRVLRLINCVPTGLEF